MLSLPYWCNPRSCTSSPFSGNVWGILARAELRIAPGMPLSFFLFFPSWLTVCFCDDWWRSCGKRSVQHRLLARAEPLELQAGVGQGKGCSWKELGGDIVARSVLPGQFTSNFPKCGSGRAKLGLPWGSVWEATLEPRCLPLLFPFSFVYLCTGCALRVHLPFPISCLEF